MQSLTKQLDESGSLLISSREIEELGFKAGETVKVQIHRAPPLEGNFLERLRRSQEIVRSFVPEGVSLADELIAERRLEALREAAGE